MTTIEASAIEIKGSLNQPVERRFSWSDLLTWKTRYYRPSKLQVKAHTGKVNITWKGKDALKVNDTYMGPVLVKVKRGIAYDLASKAPRPNVALHAVQVLVQEEGLVTLTMLPAALMAGNSLR